MTGEGVVESPGPGSGWRSSGIDDVNYDHARRSRCLYGFQKVKRVPHTMHCHLRVATPSPLCSFSRECTSKILFAAHIHIYICMYTASRSLSAICCVKTERDYTFCESISHMSMSIGAIYKYQSDLGERRQPLAHFRNPVR